MLIFRTNEDDYTKSKLFIYQYSFSSSVDEIQAILSQILDHVSYSILWTVESQSCKGSEHTIFMKLFKLRNSLIILIFIE